MAPTTSFAGVVAALLARRRSVDLYTVVRSSEPSQVAVGAKVVCPEGEAPRVFGLSLVSGSALTSQLPKHGEQKDGLHELILESGTSVSLYSERLHPPVQCIVAGAGHIGRELARLGVALGWSMTVADDRPQFASPEEHPREVRVLCVPFAELFQAVQLDRATAVVLVTRGHTHDEALLRRLAGAPVFYVGMIGSLRRVLTVTRRLREEGIDAEWLKRLYAPIGLPIGADTPAEISLAVAAEVMAAWKGRGEWARREKERYYNHS
jgi:xanthine/CO dehydrogenase XdhC/CoxF family maturation factor